MGCVTSSDPQDLLGGRNAGRKVEAARTWMPEEVNVDDTLPNICLSPHHRRPRHQIKNTFLQTSPKSTCTLPDKTSSSPHTWAVTTFTGSS